MSTKNIEWIENVMDIFHTSSCNGKTQHSRAAIEAGMDDWFFDLINNPQTKRLNAGHWYWTASNSCTIMFGMQPTDCPKCTTYWRGWTFDYLKNESDQAGGTTTTTSDDDYDRAMRGI